MISSQLAPGEPERKAISARKAELDTALQATSKEAAASIIATLLHAFPGSAKSDQDRADMLKVFVAALRDMPEWAIADVARRYLDGRLGEGRFAPTPAQFAVHVRDAIRPYLEEQHKAGMVLSASVYHAPTPEERARIASKADGLIKELVATATADKAKFKTPDAA